MSRGDERIGGGARTGALVAMRRVRAGPALRLARRPPTDLAGPRRMLHAVTGDPLPLHQAVLQEFVALQNFTSCAVDAALRSFLSQFRLPGEAQKILRILEAFAAHYHKQNPNVRTRHARYAAHIAAHRARCMQTFSHPDTVLKMAYSVVMLTTDLHHPAVKKKMTLEEYIRNHRGIDQGRDLPRELLEGIYQRVQEQGLHPAEDHVSEVERILANIVGAPQNFAQPQRHLVATLNLTEITDMHRPTPRGKHQRTLFLFNDTLLVTKPATVRREVARNPVEPGAVGSHATPATARELRIASVTEFHFRNLLPLLGMKIRHLEESKCTLLPGPRTSCVCGVRCAACCVLRLTRSPTSRALFVDHKHTFELLDYMDRSLIAVEVATARDKSSFLRTLRELIAEVCARRARRIPSTVHTSASERHCACDPAPQCAEIDTARLKSMRDMAMSAWSAGSAAPHPGGSAVLMRRHTIVDALCIPPPPVTDPSVDAAERSCCAHESDPDGSRPSRRIAIVDGRMRTIASTPLQVVSEPPEAPSSGLSESIL